MSSDASISALPGGLISQADPSAWTERLRKLVYYRDLLVVLVAKDFKVRYKNTWLGYAWSVLHPLAFAMVYFMVFRIVMRFHVEAYVLFLVAGVFPWHWTSNSINSASSCFLHNRALIRKVRFNRAILVVSNGLMEAIHFALAIPIIMLFMFYYGRWPTLSILWWVPILITIQFVTALGLALTVATCNLFFRDLERLTRIFLHLMFYLTPVIFPVSRIPPKYEWMVYANPFTPSITCWRGLFYDRSVPGKFVVLAIAWAVISLIIGCTIFKFKVRRFAEVV